MVCFILLAATLLWGGCAATKATGESAAESRPPVDSSVRPAIATIVFVDQENCCDCTRERQEATWESLQTALGTIDAPPKVEVVHLDTQAEDAQLYLDLKPIMVAPGLYFFDGAEVLSEMLQGELSVEQIARVIK